MNDGEWPKSVELDRIFTPNSGRWDDNRTEEKIFEQKDAKVRELR